MASKPAPRRTAKTKPRPKPESVASSLPASRLKARKSPPFEFVLEALASIRYTTNPMFGCLAIYRAEKIVLILRDRPTAPESNGVWLCTTHEHHESLRAEFPSLRSIPVLGEAVTGWQMLPADAPDFEESAVRACELVIAGDARIGKTPKTRRKKRA